MSRPVVLAALAIVAALLAAMGAAAAQEPGDTAIAHGTFSGTDRACGFAPFQDRFDVAIQSGEHGPEIHMRQRATGQEGVFRRTADGTSVDWITRGTDRYRSIRIDGRGLRAAYTYSAPDGCTQAFRAAFVFPAGFLSVIEPTPAVALSPAVMTPEPSPAGTASAIPWVLVIVGALLAALGSAVLVVRRARARPAETDATREPDAPRPDDDAGARRRAFPAPIPLPATSTTPDSSRARREPMPPAPRTPAPKPAPLVQRAPAPTAAQPPAPLLVRSSPPEADLSAEAGPAVDVAGVPTVLHLTHLRVNVRAAGRDLAGFAGGRDDRAALVVVVRAGTPEGEHSTPVLFTDRSAAVTWEHRATGAAALGAELLVETTHRFGLLAGARAPIGPVRRGAPVTLVWCALVLLPASMYDLGIAAMRGKIDGPLAQALARTQLELQPLLAADAIAAALTQAGIGSAAFVALDQPRGAADAGPPLRAAGPTRPTEGPPTYARHDEDANRTIRIFWYPRAECQIDVLAGD